MAPRGARTCGSPRKTLPDEIVSRNYCVWVAEMVAAPIQYHESGMRLIGERYYVWVTEMLTGQSDEEERGPQERPLPVFGV